MTENTSIKLAYHIPSEEVIHIDIADNGKDCDCKCLKCGEKLIAVQGEVRDWHFRHDTDINCDGSQETALHQLGKQIIIENKEIAIPKIGTISYSDAIAEKEFLSIRPDVTAIYNTQNLFFEIAVEHPIEKSKEDFFKKGMHKCIEIDLSIGDTSSYEKIKKAVLVETSNKTLIGWEEPKDANQSTNNWLIAFAIGLLIFFGWNRSDKS